MFLRVKKEADLKKDLIESLPRLPTVVYESRKKKQ